MADVGELAPDFELPDQEEQRVKLSSFRDERVVVLYFYPKDFTPGCTAEACEFRDSYSDFTDAGAIVLGVSADRAETHQGFADKHRLPFRLLTDRGGALARQYGVKRTLGLIAGRETFVIDKKGRIRHRFASQLFATKHVAEALRIVKQLQDES
ncbi:MAG: peroxiredoxin [Myxococcales bacterium]|nr:peroxiredoxin [Myxococcales bacterium]